ncbi:MAG: hypothetical protein AAF141_15375 [Pseudomonadota bacterium]
MRIGNKAAALTAEPELTPPPERPPLGAKPNTFEPIATYAHSGGPAIALSASVPERCRAIAALFAPLTVHRPADVVLEYDRRADGVHTLWQGLDVLAHGFIPGRGQPGSAFSLAFQLLQKLLSHRPVMAILHASAVRWHGSTLVLCGPSGSGKTTLAGLLAAAGGEHLGDDHIVLGYPSADVIPVALASTVKEGAFSILLPHFPGLAHAASFTKGPTPFKSVPMTDPSRHARQERLGALVFPKWHAEKRAAVTPLRLRPEEAIIHLADAGFWCDPAHLGAFMSAVDTTPAWHLEHGPNAQPTFDALDTIAASGIRS